MLNREIAKQNQHLNDLVQRTSEATANNIELQSDWAKYLCILSAGLLEKGLQEIYSEFARDKVPGPIANFVIAQLSAVRNPKKQRFLETAAAFKTNWKSELEVFLESDGRGDAIDTIMINRHLIAQAAVITQIFRWLH